VGGGCWPGDREENGQAPHLWTATPRCLYRPATRARSAAPCGGMRGPRRPRPRSLAAQRLRVAHMGGACVRVCVGGGSTRVTDCGTCKLPAPSIAAGTRPHPCSSTPCRAAAGRHSPSSTPLSTAGSAVRLLGWGCSSSPPSAGAASFAGPSRRAASPPAANFCAPPASVRRWAPAAPSCSTAGRLKHRRMLSMPGRERPFTIQRPFWTIAIL
jgi:hypothetical protein